MTLLVDEEDIFHLKLNALVFGRFGAKWLWIILSTEALSAIDFGSGNARAGLPAVYTPGG